MNTSITKPTPKYLYLISSRREYIELCSMEMKYIFGKTPHSSYILTDQFIDCDRSVFIKGVVTIIYRGASIEAIKRTMINDKVTYQNYKIHYHKIDSVPYQTRLNAMKILGTTIQGRFSIKDPEVELILTKINGEWIFGTLQRNSNKWKERQKKPHSYSHSLDVKIAKSAVNIVINNDFDVTLIDPCCGIGTVVIEGRFASIKTKGYEINPLVKQKCNSNLEYYNLVPDVTKTDMLESNEIFDVAILDLPYGHYSNITKGEQVALIQKTRSISGKALIISMEDMTEAIESTGYKIVDTCKIKKSNTFTRYITLCS